MIGYIKIDNVKGAHIGKVRIRILDADDYSHVKFQIELTRAEWKRIIKGDMWRACEYAVFDRPEKTLD